MMVEAGEKNVLRIPTRARSARRNFSLADPNVLSRRDK